MQTAIGRLSLSMLDSIQNYGYRCDLYPACVLGIVVVVIVFCLDRIVKAWYDKESYLALF